MTQTVHSVAIVVKDAAGRLLVVKRDDDDKDLPGVWGLPAATIREGETPEQAAVRAGQDKLGVTLNIGNFTGEDTSPTQSLREYEAEIVDGTPSVPQNDPPVSQYADLQYTNDPRILLEAARKGSLCSRIYLRNAGIDVTLFSLKFALCKEPAVVDGRSPAPIARAGPKRPALTSRFCLTLTRRP
jgi:8-oxo-dGTP diphosphatase